MQMVNKIKAAGCSASTVAPKRMHLLYVHYAVQASYGVNEAKRSYQASVRSIYDQGFYYGFPCHLPASSAATLASRVSMRSMASCKALTAFIYKTE